MVMAAASNMICDRFLLVVVLQSMMHRCRSDFPPKKQEVQRDDTEAPSEEAADEGAEEMGAPALVS